MKGGTDKSKQTRKKIYESAISLFQKNGFEETTMRVIAKEASVSLGLTYYHFKSKEEIVMQFYKHTQVESQADCKEFNQTEKNLKERIRFLLKQKLNQLYPYKNFLHVLTKSAGDPNNSLSPFSTETAEIRNEAIETIRMAINDSGEKIPEDLVKSLPEILWFYQMGIVYYWLSDKSEEKKNSFRLVDASLELVFQLFKVSKLPFMKSVRKKVLEIFYFVSGKEFTQ